MRKFACAAIVTLAVVGVAVAEDLQVLITKVDATKGSIEYKKFVGKGKDKKLDDTVHKAQLAKGAKITKPMLAFDGMNFEIKQEDVADGLKGEIFSKEKGVTAKLTIADADDKGKGLKKGEVTQIQAGIDALFGAVIEIK